MKLKTRTNQPVYYKLPVSSNMEQLSDGLLNSLKVGDVVQKKTGNQKHCYIVSYKEEKHGICLTYTDCSCVETISYDYTDGHWVFNSKDVTPLGVSGGTKLYLHQLMCTNQAGTSNYTFYCYSNTDKKFSENTGNFYCIGGIIQPSDEVKFAKFSYMINIGLGPNNVHYFVSDNMGMIIVVNDNITAL